MAEIEIHAGHEHAADGFAKRVSVAVGAIGIALAVVTIASHRAHTAAVIYRTEANDQWAFYQAKKMREHLMDVGASLAGTLAVKDPEKAQQLVQQLSKEHDRYDQDAKDLQREAQERESASQREEDRALRLDLGEGLLELGLVLTSLYFLSRRRLFPALGGAAAVVGAAVAATNWFV